jgi:transposase-like protein
MIQACPSCDSASISHNPHGIDSHKPDARDWRCSDCQHKFDEPIEREAKGGSHRKGLAGQLARMEPEDL